MLRTTRLLTCSLALSVVVAACGDPPRRAPVGGEAGGAPANATPGAATGPGQGGAVEQGEPIDLRGEVHVLGELATDVPAEAVVFVSLKARSGPPMPLLSKKADLAGVALRDDGTLVVPFVVTGADTMGMGNELTSAQLTDEYDLEVIFDPTGGLMDKSVQTRARIPIDGHDLDGIVIEVGG